MEWKVKKVIQETSHSFLNFITVTYDVTKIDGTHYDYEYFMATRHDKDHILPLTKDYSRPDGVTIPLYYVDEEEKSPFFLLPSLGPLSEEGSHPFLPGFLMKMTLTSWKRRKERLSKKRERSSPI